MSFMDRISSIENRMSQLDGQTAAKGAGAYQTASLNPGGAPPVAPVQGMPGAAPSFQSIMGTMAEGQRFKPSNVSAPSELGNWSGDSKDFDGMVAEASQKYGVDQALIKAVIKQESAFNPNASSCCGAKGLMQLMPDTGKELGVTNLTDPYQNIMGGTKYLKSLLTRFDGNLTKTIAGYNAGPGAVEQHGGLPPYPETQNYVTKVMDNYRHYKSV